MLKPFVCGSGSFNHEEDDPAYLSTSPSSTPRRSKTCKSTNKNNPYSTRGLDKFAMVLADLDEKRQKIYEQMGLQDEQSLVRFGYSSSKGGWVPIVVKLKGQLDPAEKPKKRPSESIRDELSVQKSSEGLNEISSVEKEPESVKKKSLMRRVNFSHVLMRPYYSLAFAIMLILLCLVVYGRSFAILCTSISWYLVPTIKGARDSNLRRSMKKNKDVDRKLSGNYNNNNINIKKRTRDGLASPKSKNSRHRSSSPW